MSLGLMSAGLHCVGGVDHWAEARATFEHNHDGARFMLADVTQVSAEDIAGSLGFEANRVDVIVGGPPCQGFSTVGKRDFEDPRNLLWTAFHNIVRDIRPAYVVIENVEGLIVMEKGKVRDEIIESFGTIGYQMKCKLLKAADFGVPQLRKRTFFLGWLDGLVEPQFPKPLKSPLVTVADAIFDLPVLGPSESITKYDREPTTEYQRKRRAGSTVLHNHESARHTKRAHRGFEPHT